MLFIFLVKRDKLLGKVFIPVYYQFTEAERIVSKTSSIYKGYTVNLVVLKAMKMSMQYQFCMDNLHTFKKLITVFQLHGPVKSLVNRRVSAVDFVSMMAKPYNETIFQRFQNTFSAEGSKLTRAYITSGSKRIIARVPWINRVESCKSNPDR